MANIFLEIPNFPKEKEKAVIELESASMGGNSLRNNNVGRGSDRKPEVPNIQEVTVTKTTDSYSANLYMEALGGRGRDMNIIFYDVQKQTKFLTWKLEKAFVSTFHTSGPASDKPTESLSLTFLKMTYEYDPGYFKK